MISSKKYPSILHRETLTLFQNTEFKEEHYGDIKAFYTAAYSNAETLKLGGPYLNIIGCIIMHTYPSNLDTDFLKILLATEFSKTVMCNGEIEQKEILIDKVLSIYYTPNFFIADNEFIDMELFFKKLVISKKLTKIVYKYISTKEEKIRVYENYLKQNQLFSEDDHEHWRNMVLDEFGETLTQIEVTRLDKKKK